MSTPTPLRAEAVAASVLAGSFLVLGHLLNAGAGEAGTVAGTALVLAAHVALVLAFVGAYAAYAPFVGVLGRASAGLATLGTVAVSAIVFVELAGATGVAITPVLGSPATAPIVALGPLAFVAGTLAFGAALIRAESTPASAGALLIVGTLVFAGGTVAGRFADPVTVAGAFLTGLGLVALGVALARRPATPAPRDVVAPTRH